MELKTTNREAKEVKKSKRPYQTPQVFSYGNIREITQNIGPKGALDGGGGAAAGPKTAV